MKKFVINEKQEKELIRRLNEETYQMPVDKKANKPYCINPDKVLIVKKFLDKRTAIGYGIGHGGFEVIYILVLGGINNIVYAFLINTNQFDAVISEAAAKAPEQAATLMAIPETLAAITFGTILMGILERISAMLIHISCSIIMFKAVREAGKMWLFPIAILLHASIDMIAAMYQCGLISNIYIIEAILVIWSVALILVTYNVVYKKMGSVSEKQ